MFIARQVMNGYPAIKSTSARKHPAAFNVAGAVGITFILCYENARGTVSKNGESEAEIIADHLAMAACTGK